MNNTLKIAIPTEHVSDEQRQFFSLLGERSRVPLEPLPVSTHAGLFAVAEQGVASFVWAPPVVALDLQDWCGAAPVAAVARAGRTSYPAVLVVRDDSGIQHLSDLFDRSVAWVSRLSAAGYIIPKTFLETSGLHPSAVFGRQVFAHDHRAALARVREGSVDVAASYGRVLRTSTRVQLPFGEHGLRVLTVTGFVPNDLILATRSVSPLERLSVSEALRRMHPSDLRLLGADLGVDRFSMRVDNHLDPLRRLVRLAREQEASPPRAAPRPVAADFAWLDRAAAQRSPCQPCSSQRQTFAQHPSGA